MSYQIIIIEDMPELVQQVLMFSGGLGEVWYRGAKFHDYYIEPSAYRYDKFIADSKHIEDASINAARSSMLHITETHGLILDLDWLSYLQHNGTPTRLLDWTFELQAALYFAFEDYLTNKAKPGSMPCLWVLKPAAFMAAMENYLKTTTTPSPLRHRTTVNSVVKNIFMDQRPKDVEYISRFESNLAKKRVLDAIYVPFYSSFVNERAKVQGSCFIRFPLLDKAPVSRFHEYRLEEFIMATPGFSGCLAKFIFIHPLKMHTDMSMLNLKMSRIYPEVTNIALGIKRSLFES
jgi:hypothetical protein